MLGTMIPMCGCINIGGLEPCDVGNNDPNVWMY